MSEFELIERPAGTSTRRTAEVAALLDTINSGKAVCVHLNGRRHDSMYATFYNAAKRLDNSLRLRTRKIDAGQHAYWLERKA